MITKEDLNIIKNLFKNRIGKVEDCVLRDGGVFVNNYIRPKSPHEFAPLEGVRIWFGQKSLDSNDVSVEITFDVDEMW